MFQIQRTRIKTKMECEMMNKIVASQKKMAELWKWSASNLARGIRTKEISSREAVISCLDRIEQVNPKLNAIVEVLTEEALKAADDADRAVSNGQALGPLHGVPVATKINTDQAGHVTTDGVPAFKNNMAKTDGAPIANLRKAGAVFIGRTNVPAFSLRWFSSNDLYGKTLNPWDAGRTPGGSSGGSASAVASGMVPIAHGNDLGGSIRYPAYASGIVGIRPTLGRVPNESGPPGAPHLERSLSFQTMSVHGPLARNVADLRLALTSMSNYQPSDPFHAQVPFIGEPLGKPIKVGLLRDVGIAQSTFEVNQALDKAANHLRNAGYIVEEVELPLFAEAHKLWLLLVLEDLRDKKSEMEKLGGDEIGLCIQYYLEVGKEIWGETTLEKFKHGYTRRFTLMAKLQQFLQKYPLLLLPNSSEQAFKHNEDIESLDRHRRLLAAQWPMISIPVLGFPAMSVPVSIDNGLPSGVQLLGRRFREDTILDAAEIIEAQTHAMTPIDPLFN